MVAGIVVWECEMSLIGEREWETNGCCINYRTEE